MNYQHLILFFLWLLYGLLHSLFADASVKNFFEKIMRKAFIYYRLTYSIFAFITLGLLLWYQFSIKSILLFSNIIIRYGVSFFLMLPGIIIMVICIKKYFYDLSGVKVLRLNEPENIDNAQLQQRGLHKYVRHPLYFGTLLFVWGLFLLLPFLSNLIAAIVLTIYVLFGIGLEERKLFLEYGEEYKAYSKKVPKLIPYLKK